MEDSVYFKISPNRRNLTKCPYVAKSLPSEIILDTSPRKLVVGTRKSQLAMQQTRHVRDKLSQLAPWIDVSIDSRTTTGDVILDRALSKIGEKSLFTKELEVALLRGEVDAVVHSLKDLPTELPAGLCIGAVLQREDPRDAVVLHTRHAGKELADLPSGAVIGTSSLRRTAQLSRFYPHLIAADVRGNLNTRLAKLDGEGHGYDGLMLAAAGLHRLGFQQRISQYLSPDEWHYAVGQGALAVECRASDEGVLRLIARLAHAPTLLRCIAERHFLHILEGGCHAPISVSTSLLGSCLELRCRVLSLDATQMMEDAECGSLSAEKNLTNYASHFETNSDSNKSGKISRASRGSLKAYTQTTHDSEFSHRVYAGSIAGFVNTEEITRACELAGAIAKRMLAKDVKLLYSK